MGKYFDGAPLALGTVGELARWATKKHGLSYLEALEAVREERPAVWSVYQSERDSVSRREVFSGAGKGWLKVYDVTGGEFWVSVPLGELASSYRLQGAVGDRLMPVITVPEPAGVSPLFGRDDFARVFDIARPPATAAREVQFSAGSVFYRVSGFALRYPSGYEINENSDAAWQARRGITQFIGSLVLTAKEKETFDYVNSASNVSTTFVVGSAWGTAGNPVGTIETAMQHVQDISGYRPNVVCLGRGAWKSFAANSSALQKLGYTATPDALARVLRLPSNGVVVAEAVRNLTGENFTPAYSPFFDDRVFVGYAGDGGDFSPRWGAVASWRPKGIEGNRFYVELYEGRPSGTTWIETGGWEAHLVIDKRLAATIIGTNSSQAGGI